MFDLLTPDLLTLALNWGGIFRGLVMLLFVLVSLFLILVVLIQEGKGGGIAGAFGGAAAETFGVKAGSVNRFTMILVFAFCGLALLHAGLPSPDDSLFGTEQPAPTVAPPTDTPPADAPAMTDAPPAMTDAPPAMTDAPPAMTDAPPAMTDAPPAMDAAMDAAPPAMEEAPPAMDAAMDAVPPAAPPAETPPAPMDK